MPTEPHHSHMLIIEDDKGRREFLLSKPSYSIGRDAKCDLRLISQFVSRHHATLIQQIDEEGEFRYRIVDGDSKGKASVNGLLINGRKLQNHLLNNGDEIVFGPRVRAIYYLLQRDAISTIPPDEFDITLISPNMIDDLEEWDENEDEEIEEASLNLEDCSDEFDQLDTKSQADLQEDTSPSLEDAG